jgi:hypothetical protein
MVGAVDTFIAISNATAALYAKCPPFATYHVRTDLTFFHQTEVFERDVTVRMADQVAVVKDSRSGKVSLSTPFPAPPNFEPLSDYAIHGYFFPSLDFRIENLSPLTFRDVPTHADAVARSVHGYTVAFADDTSPELGHLKLKPTSAEVAIKPHLTDVYYVPSTLVPTRIVAAGQNHLYIDARYEMVDGNWLLRTLNFMRYWNEDSLLDPLVVGTFSAAYDHYAFSETSPDPRLVPVNPPPPSPTLGFSGS